MPAEAVRFSVSLSQKSCTHLEALNAAALRVVCSIPCGHTLQRPAAEKSHSKEQSVLCSPTLYSWCLFFSVEIQGGCTVLLFDCSHCFTVAVPTTLAPFHGMLWVPSPLRGILTIENHATCAFMVPVLEWLYLCRSRVASHSSQSLPLEFSEVGFIICGFPWVYTMGLALPLSAPAFCQNVVKFQQLSFRILLQSLLVSLPCLKH